MNHRWGSGCKQGSRDWERPDFQPGAVRFRGDGQATWLLEKGGGSLPGLQKQAPSSKRWAAVQGLDASRRKCLETSAPSQAPTLGEGYLPQE